MMMPKKHFIISFFLTLIFSVSVYGQYFDSGQDPNGIRWRQIRSENFQIIFPEGFEEKALWFSTALEHVYSYASATLQCKPDKISVILHNRISQSNAFVTLAPRRSEFYTIAPQDIYPQDWLAQLALHEFRHVVQLDKMKQGFTKILYYLLGEQGQAAVVGLYLPTWLLEGDAVVSETGLSNTGRGRLPEFEMPLRTQVIGKRIYSYEKAYFGSYRDFVPDHYVLGYQMVGYGREKYGAYMWGNAMQYAARNPYNPTAFSTGIKKNTGMTKWKFYSKALNHLDTVWKSQETEINFATYKTINTTDKRVFTNYRFPQFINDSTLIALKSGLSHIQQYVVPGKNGKDIKVFTPGFSDPVWLSASNNKIIWSEYHYDKRWSNRIYYDLILYDIEKRERKRLTRNKYYYAPCLSPDASKIAVVEALPEGKYFLLILNIDGKELNRVSVGSNDFIVTPRFSQDGSNIVYIALDQNGKRIESYEIATEKKEILLESRFQDITQPIINSKFLFFHGIWSGIDNIYAKDLANEKIYKVTSARYGAFSPEVSPDSRYLYFNEYSPDGHNIVYTEIKPENWEELEGVKNNSNKFYNTLAGQETLPDLAFTDTVKREIKKYSKAAHLFRIHSWAPAYVDVNSNTVSTGASILSQNLLSTSFLTLGYRYNYNEQTSGVEGTYEYKGFYPVISASVSYGRRASFSYLKDSLVYNGRFEWNQSVYSLITYIPFNFTRGKYVRGLRPAAGISAINVQQLPSSPPDLLKGNLIAATYSISGYRYLKMAYRDLAPRWGQTFSFQFRHSPFGDNTYRSHYAGTLRIYLPGIIRHHSLRISGGIERQFYGTYTFGTLIGYPRGFYHKYNRQLAIVSLNYALPLLYPDLKIGPVLYVKRIRANLFYDYGAGRNKSVYHNYNSTGVELIADYHFLNLITPLATGFRYIYLPDRRASRVELLFNINFDAL